MKTKIKKLPIYLVKLIWRLTMIILQIITNLFIVYPLNAVNNLLQHLEFRHKKDAIYILIILNIIVWNTACRTGDDFIREYKEVKTVEAKTQKEIAIERLDEGLSMEEWVLNEWGKLGQREQAYAVIQCESRWDEYAVNVNRNGSKDFGLYQINTIHKIPNECAFDYKCATEFAIKLWEKQGWSPWVCANNLGIK